MKMLELFGASAVSWTIEKVERPAPPREKREKTPTASWRWISVLPNPSASEAFEGILVNEAQGAR